MNTEITTKAAQQYINEGLSIFPCKADKAPVYPLHLKAVEGKHTNKICQTHRMTMEDLFPYIDKGCNIGIMCGQISGNLECIDVDSKYKEGFDAIILQDLKQLFPELLKRLRIQRTPSGGLHLIYRCTTLVEGNKKLAGYIQEGKKVNFLETRGEGGYFLGFPSAGYSMVNDVPIPILTPEERASLLGLMRSYNEIVEPEKPKFQEQKKTDQNYSTSPFQDFNERCDPIALLEQLGYKFVKDNNRFIHFTRPDKSKGVSVSFIKQHRLFYYFTTSTDLDSEKGYSPAFILNKYLHNGDWKETYRYLIENGYGTYKPYAEKHIIRQAALGRMKAPGNLSANGQAELALMMTEMSRECEHGIFWVESRQHGMQIDRERLIRVSSALGFQVYQGEIYRLQAGILYHKTNRNYIDDLKAYIHDPDAELQIDIYNAFEKFMESHYKWMISRLPELDETNLLQDDRENSFKVYRNAILQITSDGIAQSPLDGTTRLIFFHQIQDRDFEQCNESIYLDYLDKAVGITPYVKRIIGWLCHTYKDETIPYFLVLQEKTQDAMQGGGSGKNIFCNLLNFSNRVYSRPAHSEIINETLLQGWQGEGILVLSDPDKHFPYKKLKEYTSGDVTVKKLYKDFINIKCRNVPKIVVPTNYSIEIEDGGMKRRVRYLEFTDFFTRAGGIYKHFGKKFPDDWTEQDWNGFDTFIASCIHEWLKSDCELPESDLSELGWKKQFDQTYRIAAQIIESLIETWVSRPHGFTSNEQFKKDIEDWLLENSQLKHKPSPQRMNQALSAYCEHYGIDYKSDQRKLNSTGRVFGKGSDETEVDF